MAAVEDADLHQLEGRDVRDELHADLFQRRPPVVEAVLEHPLPERLAEHRPVVADAEFALEDLALALAGGGRDAVDHAVRKGDVLRDPAGEVLVDQARQPYDGIGRDMAVMGNVVAGHHREGDALLVAPAHQSGEDQAEDGLRRRHVPRVGDDVGMRRVESSGRRVDEIAALGDGHRDDADPRVGELVDDGLRVAGRQEVDHHAGDARLPVAGVLLDHGGQPVLRLEPGAAGLLALEHTGADQRPVMPLARVEQVVEIDRLVRAVEIADAEMHDARFQRSAVIGWPADSVGQVEERFERQGYGHVSSNQSAVPSAPKRCSLLESGVR